jgi:hypothetical protein
MKYSVAIKTSGIESGVEMIAEDEGGLMKMVWNAEYITSHVLQVRRYSFYKRTTKRHNWVRDGVIGGWDKRQDTLSEMPPPPPELCDLAIKEWGKITVNWEDWKKR